MDIPMSHPDPKNGDTLLFVGTMKGAFIFTANADRKDWTKHGPYFAGESVYSLAYDERGGKKRTFAATRSFHWGSNIRRSDDFGETWSAQDRQAVRFPEGSNLSLTQVWQIVPGPRDEPEVVWAGVEPTALFQSRDGGESWSAVDGLLNHPHRPQWTPGGGGMCLHTIVPDPVNKDRMVIAMSTGGCYRTDDGGATWRARNVGVRAQFLPNKYPEFGQCVHKIAYNPAREGRLFLQNHWGLYRSDDWGDNWTDIANGVPSDFGFAMQTHPHDPDTVYVLPLEPATRTCPGGAPAVWRSENGGDSWSRLARGLPKKASYFTILRDAMDIDRLTTPALYFGTTTGQLWIGREGGEKWDCLFDSLPPIHNVKVAVV
jgi:photosystem II stability/assembly factor-like uncharacterized protein